MAPVTQCAQTLLIAYLLLSSHVAVASWVLTIYDCWEKSSGVDKIMAGCVLQEAAEEVDNVISCWTMSDDVGETILCLLKQIAKQSDIIDNAISCSSKSNDVGEMIVCFLKETAKTYLQKLLLGALQKIAIKAVLQVYQWTTPKLKQIT